MGLCTIVSIEGQKELSSEVYFEADRDDQKNPETAENDNV